MNTFLKKALIGIAILAGMLALLVGGVFLKMGSELSKFTPMETGKLMEGIFVIKDDFANFFIVEEPDGARIVIDCGISPTVAAKEMEKLGIQPEEVAAVFLTHTDADHVGALSLFGKAKLYMAKEEEQMLNGQKSKRLFPRNSISRTDYILLENRQVVHIGALKVEAILAPGHTSGMTAYLVNDKHLFTGDILSLKEGNIAPIPGFFNMDTAQALKSMEMIRQIATAKQLFTSHWGYVDNDKTAVE